MDVLMDVGGADGTFDNQTRAIVNSAQAEMQEHLSELNAIIHDNSGGSGSEPGDSSETSDREESDDGSSDAQSQDEIDQLFG